MCLLQRFTLIVTVVDIVVKLLDVVMDRAPLPELPPPAVCDTLLQFWVHIPKPSGLILERKEQAAYRRDPSFALTPVISGNLDRMT